MKTTKTIFLIATLIMLSIQTMHSQTYEWQQSPKPSENYQGMIVKEYDNGTITYKCDSNYQRTDIIENDDRKKYTTEELYYMLLSDAKKEYGNNIVLRQFKVTQNNKKKALYGGPTFDTYKAVINVSATVYTPAPPKLDPAPISVTQKSKQSFDPLTQAINKALLNIREGSRLALDQVRTINGEDKEDFKDQVVEILLDEGYKVVAKEYLDRLYEEQQSQQSGIYNDRTTVQENNFSAVGYYINVKKSDTSIKVQIINVSTGEYESNVTVSID